MTKVVIIGGGPGGYEAALVASQLGGEVTLIERDGLGGAAVLSDCVPSKTLIATAEVMVRIESARQLGLHIAAADVADVVRVDLEEVNRRVLELARAQSHDIKQRLIQEEVRIVSGTARLDGGSRVVVGTGEGEESYDADIILVATGTTPRELPAAPCDGERILNWKQVYNLTEVPERLIVVGSGVTGAEFASAYDGLGCDVVLVSSRTQVLPGEDQDAAAVLQKAFEGRGMTIMSQCRAVAARREGAGVVVTLADGREVHGSHVLMAVGSIPNTSGIGLEEAGVELSPSGHIVVDRVSRTSNRNIYAAGDVTGVFALASVAAMQGRVAMWHSLGDAVTPLDLRLVSSNVFTTPEVATVGVSQKEVDAGEIRVASMLLPLGSNARSKMQGFTDGFVKLFCLPTTGIIVGGVVVAPRASELIHAVSLAVAQRVNVDDFSHAFTVYPSMSGSLAEAARRLHHREGAILTN
ncbi:dihydrolipoamide dehydrogenase [Tessaracoccus bendigoensis DSM 12906]|uniref:Dihydrolipoamide dehydrogenase n=1 Tax=Tessaracoccus bendigoensis DSM 12906 TaxID=1123357 RepID=A0A1M6K4G9_9ACTN|nr:NAD(P)H-quinone dehydrogenase [Tessaracoccus bendigoensis]SHJ53826.1 dihydrolipoamide dehydrogenase [Tessaracoccus bendigoensis DSM 12906]